MIECGETRWRMFRTAIPIVPEGIAVGDLWQQLVAA